MGGFEDNRMLEINWKIYEKRCRNLKVKKKTFRNCAGVADPQTVFKFTENNQSSNFSILLNPEVSSSY